MKNLFLGLGAVIYLIGFASLFARFWSRDITIVVMVIGFGFLFMSRVVSKG